MKFAPSIPVPALRIAPRAKPIEPEAMRSPAARTLRLSPARMYERVLASDTDYDGRFFTGVMTTGIYCLPSCKARKPKPGNVRFFASCEEARAAGLRPCRKCHPDDFARGADPVLEIIETLVREIREKPAAFADARAIVRRSGFGTTRAFELFRRHFHTTPADVLLRARIDVARRHLLQSMDTVADVAFAAGFETLSVFHENFRQLTGLTPADYRALHEATEFEIALPQDYSLAHLRHALSRDTESVSERLEGDNYTVAVRLADRPVGLALCATPRGSDGMRRPEEIRGIRTPEEIRGMAQAPALQGPPETALIRLQLSPSTIAVHCAPGTAPEVHTIVVRMLGLDQDAAGFSRLAKRLGFSRLTQGSTGLRISLTTSVFDGLLWAIIGQQINFAFACRLKRRLFELCGTPAGDGLIAPPPPEAMARLEPGQLVALQFSQQKANYLIATARLVADGTLDLESLRSLSATRAERTLLAVRGLGPWSVNYLMMRSLGFADCVPLGDTGVTSGLQRLMDLEQRPDVDATRRLMSIFSPHRSLATAHLWQLNRKPA